MPKVMGLALLCTMPFAQAYALESAQLSLTLLPDQVQPPLSEAPADKVAAACVVTATGITIDGDLADWGDCAWTEIEGDDSLRAAFKVAVDEDSFYLAVRVHDKNHHNEAAAEDMWRGDSIQFAVDPLGTRNQDAYDADDYEYGLALIRGRPVVWRWQAATRARRGPVENAELAVRRAEDTTLYELRLPLTELHPLMVLPDQRPGFTIAINDSDGGEGRDRYIEWTPGITQGKDPASFGRLSFPQALAFAHEPLLVHSELERIFADVDEDYHLRLLLAAQDEQQVTLRVLLAEDGEVALQETLEHTLPAGMSRTVLRVSLRGIARLKGELQLEVLPHGRDSPLHQAAYTVYKYDSSAIR